MALHELGHGTQLAHIISATGVMNFAIANGATRRTLDADADLAAARNMGSFSTSATSTERCGRAAYQEAAAEAPLPVQLVAFGASYQPNQGTLLSWATA